MTLERDETVIVFRGVPAEVCENCGETYLDEAVTRSLLQAAAEAAGSGVEVDIRQFTAA